MSRNGDFCHQSFLTIERENLIMEHLLKVEYTLHIITREDVGVDEPRIEIAFLRIINNRADVALRDSGMLATVFPNSFGITSGASEIRNKFLQVSYDPQRDGNYIGIVVRAIEEDHSSETTRSANRDSFTSAIQNAAQQALDAGHTPTVDEIWSAGHATQLLDTDFVDDDDRIGVSARVYPAAGEIISKNDGSFSEDLELRFTEEGGHYLLTGKLIAIPNPLI